MMFTRWFRHGWPRRSRQADAGHQAAQSAVRRVVASSGGLDPFAAASPRDDQFEARWRDGVKQRVVFVLAALSLWTIALEGRLIFLQVVEHDEMTALAARQQEKEIKLIPPRGDIVDRNGQMLAYTVDGQALVADPSAVEDPAATLAKICQALADCTKDKRAAIARGLNRRGYFAYLDRNVSPDQAERLRPLDLAGVRLIPEPRRYYPKVELAAHVLGFVGIDNEGLGGVESRYDDVVRGTEGRMLLQVDARRTGMDSRVQQAPTPGATLELTLDLYLQHIVERELRDGVEGSRAKGGTAIAMDPRTGEILAMASYPTFNPNVFRQFSQDERRNRAIQDVYEPGSTFKIVTASAALEDGIFKLTDLIDTNPGVIKFPGRKPITEDKHHNYGVLTVEDVVVRSSNVGAIKIGLQVGAERMNRYVRQFGFGQALLPDLAGQSRGIVWNLAKLKDSDLASVSMGYQVGVTPLQMVTAASVVANGGILFEPHVVRAIVRGHERQVVAPKPLRRVISQETAGLVTRIMEGVAERGTGKLARLAGYPVAGKTGTAAKLVDRRYSTTDYNVSFLGFVPSRDPVLAILVVVDTPRNGSPYGGTVAAPIFQKIADAALRQLAVPPTINPPPVILASDTSGIAARHTRAAAVVPAVVQAGGVPVMPDVTGLSAREALRVLTAAGLVVRVRGSGLVVDQTPPAGEPIEPGGASVLELSRHPNDAGRTR